MNRRIIISRKAKLKNCANIDPKMDMENIEADLVHPEDMLGLDRSIIAYGPIYSAFSNAGKFSLEEDAVSQRVNFLKSLNL